MIARLPKITISSRDYLALQHGSQIFYWMAAHLSVTTMQDRVSRVLQERRKAMSGSTNFKLVVALGDTYANGIIVLITTNAVSYSGMAESWTLCSPSYPSIGWNGLGSIAQASCLGSDHYSKEDNRE